MTWKYQLWFFSYNRVLRPKSWLSRLGYTGGVYKQLHLYVCALSEVMLGLYRQSVFWPLFLSLLSIITLFLLIACNFVTESYATNRWKTFGLYRRLTAIRNAYMQTYRETKKFEYIYSRPQRRYTSRRGSRGAWGAHPPFIDRIYFYI